MVKSFSELLERIRQRGRTRIVVAGGEDLEALKAVEESYRLGFGEGILVGDPVRIEQALTELGGGEFVTEVIPAATEEDTARLAVEEVRRGGILLKGAVKTAVFMKGVLNKEWGLRTDHVISSICVFQDERDEEPRLVLMSDGGIVIKPDLQTLLSLIYNAVRIAHKLDNPSPKVALLSALEVVSLDMPETLNAAVLAKMNDRGQIPGCVVDGPLALDNAISAFAARKKGLDSPVAGDADILIVPDITAGDIFAKGLQYYAHAKMGITVVGTSAPVMIPSRADRRDTRLNSIALAVALSD
jgi:phosphate butyryltransferase